MGDFLCVSELKKDIKNNSMLYIIATTLCVIGIICGIVIKLPDSLYEVYFEKARIFMNYALNTSIFRLIFREFLFFVLIFLLSFPMFFTKFYLPVSLVLGAYKGAIYGVFSVVLLKNFSFIGIFCWFILVLPQILFFTVLFPLYVCISFSHPKDKVQNDFLSALRLFSCFLLFISIFFFVEFILGLFVFRPLSFLF